MLQGLQSRFSAFRELDTEILAISTDAAEDSRTVVEAYDLEFPLLSDPDGAALDGFGVRHRGGGIDGGDIARPAAFILDREGRIVWRELTENWRVRVRPERLLDELVRIP